MATNVLGGNYYAARGFFERNCGTVNARPESAGCDSINPGKQIAVLFGEQTPTLFLVKKDDSFERETFFASVADGDDGVGLALGVGVSAILYLGSRSTIKENRKTESSTQKHIPLACPRCLAFAWRSIQPVAAIGKASAQGLKVLIAGIIIAIKA